MTYAATHQREVHTNRFGLRVAALLNEQALPHDISERLRIARQQAMAQRKAMLAAEAKPQWAESFFSVGSSAILGGESSDWMRRLMGIFPLLVLAVGLVVINTAVTQERDAELADVDIELLTDDLPPAAHTDPGFAQFLKFGPPSAHTRS